MITDLIVVVLVMLIIYLIVRKIEIALYYKKYPLAKKIPIKINMELMNSQYKYLSENEKAVLLAAQERGRKAFLIRKIKNEIFILFPDEGERLVYQTEKIDDKWIKYIEKRYYVKRIFTK